MAVELENLYADLDEKCEVTLRTSSCFQKMIGWIHMVEDTDFAPFLHGDELVFNSGLNYVSEEWLKNFIKVLNQKHSGGLIIALRDGLDISQDIITYCNEIEFPLFSATWKTPYIDIMRSFSVILLRNEQKQTNLSTALKNAIFFSDNEKLYVGLLEGNGFFRDLNYNIIILSCNVYNTERGNEKLAQIQRGIHHILKKQVVYEENNRLVILTTGYSEKELLEIFQKICEKDDNIYVGIGTTVRDIREIYKSYEHAYTAYQLTKAPIKKNILAYEELGIYKILSDVKEPEIYPRFVDEVLGNLIEYDEKNGTDYVKLLEIFFMKECNIVETAKATFCHKNTMAYKINKIKDIMGLDITKNKNRAKIMVAYYIIRARIGLPDAK